ncbi:MAG: MFS transporter [Bacteroidetes bacterium]|nr:MFS transporter [Bacteroidota bacterium]MBU1579142.1 MFS transporter [Bacteroidota bacterium]MBU2556888.1 MFS transporter [Bacteroidota bacterium]
MLFNIKKETFLKRNFPLLLFGFLLTFFSSFGQTFLLSLYVPAVEAMLQISNTEFGSVYAVATIGSALTLPWLGSYFDKVDIKPYSLAVIIGLACSLLLLSFSYHIVVVVIAFYGLRLFGQGLLSHTSISAMARYFSANRGKAIGLVGLGYPTGEAVLPIAIALLIGGLGWRGALQLSAANALLLLVPLVLILLHLSKSRLEEFKVQQTVTKTTSPKLSIWQLFAQKRFWIIAPVVFILGFTNTAVFFFQLKFGLSRGWSPELVAGSISAFALTSALSMLGAGTLVDRFSGKRLFPYYMAPYLIGLMIFVFFSHPLAYPIGLAFMGLSNGAGSTIKSAMLAEIYGIAIIGQIRSVFSTVMVLSTALGPVAFGVLLDSGVSFPLIFSLIAVAVLLTVVNGMRRL